MKCSNVLKCSFSSWYSEFRHLTIESAIIPLPKSFIKYLQTDGIVLPKTSTHGLYTKSKNTAMDADEDDEDIRDDELMNMYEADWSTPDSNTGAEAPEFGKFEDAIMAAIKSLGGRVFPKLNWSSPKDASWIAFDRTLMCTCPSDIYLLLKSSEFITHDLEQPFLHCEDYKEEISYKMPEVAYTLVLRRWQPPDPSTEFRCFVGSDRLIGVCPRETSTFYPHIVEHKEAIVDDILTFFQQKISKFPDSCYVFDVVRPKEGELLLVDFNPFGPVTDSLWFSWQELQQLADHRSGDPSSERPTFVCALSEDGVQSSEYARYALPQDIRDLTAGEDAHKLMDLMNLKIQGKDESSSEGEDEDQKSNVNEVELEADT